jgi:hypothetical protein
MSAIDFSMDIVRTPDPKGDRVNVVLSGKLFAVQNLLISDPGCRLAPWHHAPEA